MRFDLATHQVVRPDVRDVELQAMHGEAVLPVEGRRVNTGVAPETRGAAKRQLFDAARQQPAAAPGALSVGRHGHPPQSPVVGAEGIGRHRFVVERRHGHERPVVERAEMKRLRVMVAG